LLIGIAEGMEGEEERIQEESQPHCETISGNAIKDQAEGMELSFVKHLSF